MPYVLRYHPQVAATDLPRIAPENKRRIERAIAGRLTSEPQRYGVPLTGTLRGYRKLRVGDYRVIFTVGRTEVFILAVVHRRCLEPSRERPTRAQLAPRDGGALVSAPHVS